MVTHHNIVPHELRNKIQPLVLAFFERPAGVTLFGPGFALPSLYGPIFGHPSDHNGLLYLLAPWVCPWLSTTFHLFVPYNPYRGSPLFVGKFLDLDQHDPDAKNLVQLFQSKQAQRFLLITTVKLSIILFMIMAPISVVVRESLNWSISSNWFVAGVLGCCIGAEIVIASQYIGWGLRSWANSCRGGKT